MPTDRWRLLAAVRRSVAFRGGLGAGLQGIRRRIAQEGWRGLWTRVTALASAESRQPEPDPAREQARYQRWIRRQQRCDRRARGVLQSVLAEASSPPTVSVLLAVTSSTDPKHLADAIRSVRAQVYPRWTICIADASADADPAARQAIERAQRSDPRIRITGPVPAGSAPLEAARRLAEGDIVVVLDPSDRLHPIALLRVAATFIGDAGIAVVYTDEDRIDGSGRRSTPYFKPDFDYDLLLGQPFMDRLFACRRSLLDDLSGMRPDPSGAEVYDLCLRITERVPPAAIHHLPLVLCHRLADSEVQEVASNRTAAVQRAAAEHLQRVSPRASVEPLPEAPACNRIRFEPSLPAPTVELIVPTRDRADMLARALETLLGQTAYGAMRLCLVDNGSTSPDALAVIDRWRQDSRVRVIRDDRPFNFSVLNNEAVAGSQAEFVCLVNNDVEVITSDWLSHLVANAERPGVGCVGARLWYPDDTLQHAGIALGVHRIGGHVHRHLARGRAGYFGRAVLLQSWSAVTAACLLVRREIWRSVGGMDERLSVAFNDIDLCLRVRASGYRNLWVPQAELRHHESVSRGAEDDPAKIARFRTEIALMEQRWPRLLADDPAYSPNLSLLTENFAIDPGRIGRRPIDRPDESRR